jgi:hypothetical protein
LQEVSSTAKHLSMHSFECIGRKPSSLRMRLAGAKQAASSPTPGGGILRSMEALKAVVKNGRLILDEATTLPQGAEVELAVVHDDGDAELLEELEVSAADEAAGNLIDFDTLIARLGSKP